LEPFWILKKTNKKTNKTNYPTPLGTAFACRAQPFPLGQTQPLPVGFFTQKTNKTSQQGHREEKRIKI